MTTPILLLCFVLSGFGSQSSFSIIGSVRDSDGRILSSVRVSVLDDNYQPVRTVFADGSGRFKFRGLRQGIYTVRVETAGTNYEEQIQRVEFQSLSNGRGNAEEVFPVDFVLKRKKNQAAPDAPAGVVFGQPIPDAARAEYERGVSRLKDDKSAQGIEALKKSIEIFPDYYNALELLGTEYVKIGELSAAVPVLTRAVEINRDAPKSLYALGVAHLKLGDTSRAIDWLRKAAEQGARNVNVHMMLGVAYGTRGALGEAEESLKKADQLSGGSLADVHLYLAGIYNKQEKYAAAVRELELYLKKAKDLKDTSRVKEMIDKLKAKEKAGK
jgi:tetratricopeptide (TPR) repeat protein